MEGFSDQLGGYAPLIINAVKALVVLIVGWIVAGLVGSFVRRQVRKHQRIDQTLGNFAATVATWAIRIMVLLAVLNLFGIEATSVVAVLGAATLAIGLALQGTLADLAAGIMLVIFRPYKLGQYVDIGGTSGTVSEIALFFTELTTPQNVQIIVPNGQAWGSIITNYSAHDTRRLDLTFGIDYADSADTAMQIILENARTDERVMQDPEPWARVTNLGDSSVDITARLWTSTADFWNVKFELTKAIKEDFDAKGISIPFPHQVNVEPKKA
ncbi:mechanosensitive ion channel family protein [Roseovarius sp. S1116L3]|uniref:mechanosensitive ion channel family protein n=1 Tax=Roseovarius roseus TaxID=3342636 RepID=UPI00372A5136